MHDRRVERGVKRGKPFEIEVDGETIVAYKGETIAAALIAAGRRIFRRTSKKIIPVGCIVVSDFVMSA